MDFFLRTAVQKGLNEKTRIAPALSIDGVWGSMTVSALKSYQQQNGLTQTGQYDAATQAKLGPFLAQKYLSLGAVQTAANALGVSVQVMIAAALTESQSSGFFSDGTCAILFERHKMYAYYSAKYGQAKADAMARAYPAIINPIKGGYLLDQAEYTRYNKAVALDRDCAMLSTSWGLFQIMGFNYAACGFNNVVAYTTAVQVSEQAQLTAFVNFTKTNAGGKTWAALKAKNWTQYATYYNGTGNVAAYAQKMENSFNSAASLMV